MSSYIDATPKTIEIDIILLGIIYQTPNYVLSTREF